MSGALHTRKTLKTTVAAAAVGVIVFAPLTPLAEDAVGAPGAVVRIGANDGFTRIEFAGAAGARTQIRRRGDQVVVRTPAGQAADIARLLVDPPAGVTRAESRMDGGALELTLTLAPEAQVRTGRADGAVYLNIHPTGEGAPPAPVAPAAPASGVAVAVEASDTQARFVFPWGQPVGAAVFRRGAAVWVVFDTPARLNLNGEAALGPVTGARWAAGEDYVALRLEAPQGLAVSAQSEGSTWTVTVGGSARAASGVTVGHDDAGADPALSAQMAGATRAIWLTDPLVGDRFAAVAALGPAKGFGERRRLVDLTLLPTAQGLAVETATDDLEITPSGDLVRLSRPSGLNLSPPSAGLETAHAMQGAPRRAPMPALILSEWSDTGEGGFGARHRQLQDAAAEETVAAADAARAPVEARMALARFLIGSGLAYESIGVLNGVVAEEPGMISEPELRGLRGAARASIGRFAEAQADFSGASLANDPSTQAWLGYVAASQGDWAAARQAFARAASAIDRFPPLWRARFGVAHARAAVETGDLQAAEALIAYAVSQDIPAADQLDARLVQARLLELDGQNAVALAIYKAVARAPLDGVATPAKLGEARLELASGAITPQEAASRLEPLRWRWRGDATELSVIRQLGGIYLSQGRYREALDALRGAGKRLPDLPEAVELQNDLATAFRALFLDGAADGLQPVQALALFYDFRDLTPVGAEGDDMVRRLARRLVDVDLLDPAAELLKHQVDNRLEGVAKAQVATDLAMIYLMDRQPEAALQALWGSRSTLLPSTLNAERRAIEARALMELGRFDHALEILGDDTSEAAQDVRAEVYWKTQNYGGAAALYERRLGERHADAATALTPEDESRVIRAGVGYSLARDAAGLARIAGRYRGFADQARAGAAMRIALEGPGAPGVRPGDYAALAERADLFAGWVTTMKQAFRERAGG